MRQKLRQLDIFLDTHRYLLGYLALVVGLRVPSLVEPYWYGDEGIYLTLGQAMRSGELLYTDIVDHKTPLIYYFAMVPNQFWFRILMMAAMVVTTFGFIYLSRQLIKRRVARVIATLLFIFATNLPALEGNIPNGELFVMCFIFMGAAALVKTNLFQYLAWPDERKVIPAKSNRIWLVASGLCFGLAILTKVPAVFDVLAFMAIGWFGVATLFLEKHPDRTPKTFSIFTQLGILGAAILAPIILSILYFVLRGSGAAYLNFGLLYNFRYAGSWKPSFALPFVGAFFSLPAKMVLLSGWLLILTMLSRYLTKRFLFLAGWVALALVAATLSNRPYPHYFLQVIPPLCLMVGYVISIIKVKLNFKELSEVALATVSLGSVVAVMLLLQVTGYPTISYYLRFWRYATHQISWETYRDEFNYILADNYAATHLIKTSSNPEMFIWGTNPNLYAQARKNPVGRFTVAFHIADFKAEEETLRAVEEKRPTYIVVMKEERELPGLNRLLENEYMPNTSFQNFVLWKRWADQLSN